MFTLTRRVLISAPKESVQRYLRDLENLPRYDKKVESVSVASPDAQSGLVEVSGRFLGLPWRGAFRCEFTRDGGLVKETIQGPLPRVVGAIRLRPVSGGTEAVAEEQYRLPGLLRPLAALLAGMIARGIERELGVIKEGAERLHRQDQLREIEAL